jgi:anaphase-promoting complex subunit 8
LTENLADLSHLAHTVVRINKYCPESCCVVGNLYSLRGMHERAVVYFQRALRLDPKYLSAWTLMGHEYMELHNTAAAVQAYRTAGKDG